jgi:hypothetical protein
MGRSGSRKSKRPTPALLRRLVKHFDTDPGKLPVLEQDFAVYERPNLHMAIEELLAGEARAARLIGVVVDEEYHGVTLAKMSNARNSRYFDEGPVEYVDVPLADERTLACVKRGLHLFRDDGRPVALLVSQPPHAYPEKIRVAVMAEDRERAERVLRRLTRETRLGKAHRGHVLSVEQSCSGELSVRFHRLPQVGRDEVILPAELMRRIERHTTSFTRNAARLRAAGRHLKRGVLLYGPPGTGKTLSAMYLASQMPGRTVVILTGGGMGSIEVACGLARLMEPATIILEDVDLIGTERGSQTVGANALLFELLNQMDGLAEDADVLFVLTTNRPEMLEPALAARPGRIDQAIEVPPPDAECRRRLLALYGRGLAMKLGDPTRWSGGPRASAPRSSASCCARPAVFAAEESHEEGNGDGTGPPELVVSDRHVDEALAELLMSGGALTRSLLGGVPVTTPAGNGTADAD